MVKEHGQRIPLSQTARYRQFPEDMPWARSISRLHKRLFPDVTRLHREASNLATKDPEPLEGEETTP